MDKVYRELYWLDHEIQTIRDTSGWAMKPKQVKMKFVLKEKTFEVSGMTEQAVLKAVLEQVQEYLRRGSNATDNAIYNINGKDQNYA